MSAGFRTLHTSNFGIWEPVAQLVEQLTFNQ